MVRLFDPYSCGRCWYILVGSLRAEQLQKQDEESKQTQILTEPPFIASSFSRVLNLG